MNTELNTIINKFYQDVCDWAAKQQPAQTEEIRTYSVQQAADILKVKEPTIREFARKGKIGCFKVGKITAFTEKHIKDYIEENSL